ncbi:hypothetical protein GCM10019059_15480 [Camelimonas fluminis]|uniref:DUF1624 domain-containing protein n=1 Tax=Camelimonas fluminis TaxID=1576911 RepID=A0ABV7UMP3_9HYPH|nr:heparan-alpha-glucosaminide N-acetyltransferase [Camelimonas fluminis]GHE57013.1 hypothetical protein GCM10019059_15480 [Camelimonas fluminis]
MILDSASGLADKALSTPSASTTSKRTVRLPIIDAARGVALAAMVIYHSAWDITFFNLAPIDAVNSPFWRNFAHGIASSFLFLVGVSLVLASQNGVNWTTGYWKAWGKRMAMVVAGAAAVTASTWFTNPQQFIFFGILHCIAAASILALPFLRAPWPLTALAGAGVIALPFFWTSPLFSHGPLIVTGLADVVPNTADWVPIFPWFGAVLLGVAAARACLAWFPATAAGRWRDAGRIGKTLTFAGRHSLIIYLTHQIVLMGLFGAIAWVIGPSQAALDMRVTRTCHFACAANAGSEAFCQKYCDCLVGSLRQDGLSAPVVSGDITPAGRARLGQTIGQCSDAAKPQ